MKLILGVLLGMLPFAVQAQSTTAYVIKKDLGGFVHYYKAIGAKMYGQKLIIDGPCASSCTLYLRTDYDMDVCITKNASLGFHKPYSINPRTMQIVRGSVMAYVNNEIWNKEFYSMMPKRIQMALDKRRIPSVSDGAHKNSLAVISGRELRTLLPVCAVGWQKLYALRSTSKAL